MKLTKRRRNLAFFVVALLTGIIAPAALADPFVDISGTSGLALNGRNKGVAIADVDGDGLLDIFISNKGGPSHLYLNNGDGTFRDVTEEAGLEETGYAMGSVFGDVANHGKPDLYVAKGGRYEIESNRLYYNVSTPGHPKFIDITESAGVGIKTFTYGAAMFDYNKDGKLDIYCANYGVGQRNILFKNVSTGHRPEDVKFVDASDEAGVGSAAWAWSAVAFDFDGDGWDDLYVSNGQYPGEGRNILYKNLGNGKFKDVTDEAGVANNAWALGTGVGDINNDGWLDMYVSNYVGGNKLFLNPGNGKFKDISKSSGTARDGWGKGTAFGDTDHKGFQHIFEGDCKFSKQFYHNNGDLTFTDIIDRYPSMKLETIRTKGVAFFDMDNDGDLDLIVMNWEVGPRLFRNDQNDKNWIKVKVEGTTYDDPAYQYRSTRDAVGAKVRLYRNGKMIAFRQVMTANGFCSCPPLEVHFGADANYRYDIEVTFPSGIKVVKKNVSTGVFHHIREDE
ncbi:MAG: CRTAC1 family protein [Deltaproteobacteria bacterium]|nr:CRTAC1 family protein [Deltaproteobacteria bacterium]